MKQDSWKTNKARHAKTEPGTLGNDTKTLPKKAAMNDHDADDMKYRKGKTKAKKLTTTVRNDLPKTAFVFPGTRKYPIHDEAHARNALARVAQNGSPSEQATVKAAVHKRYPNIK